MVHPAILKNREEAVDTCRKMISGEIDYLIGCRTLSTLAYYVGLEQFDQDFIAFVAVDSETDALPIGSARQYWNPDRLKDLEPKIKEAEEWAKDFSLEKCHSIIKRFGA